MMLFMFITGIWITNTKWKQQLLPWAILTPGKQAFATQWNNACEAAPQLQQAGTSLF